MAGRESDSAAPTYLEKVSAYADIFAKVAVPILVALGVQWWSSDRSKDETARSMVQIAVGVLMAEPARETTQLRFWAIDVLRQPDDPPHLSDTAAKELYVTSLPPIEGTFISTIAVTKSGMASGAGFPPDVSTAPDSNDSP